MGTSHMPSLSKFLLEKSFEKSPHLPPFPHAAVQNVQSLGPQFPLQHGRLPTLEDLEKDPIRLGSFKRS
jgi:hypothetical protein